MRPLSWPSVASGWTGIVAFVCANGLAPTSLAALLVAAVATALRGRWQGPADYFARTVLAPLVGGLAATLLLDAYPEFPLFYLAAGLVAATGLMFLRPVTSQGEATATTVFLGLTLLSAYNEQEGALPVGLCVAAQVALVGISTRLRMGARKLPGSILVCLGLTLGCAGLLGALLRGSEIGIARLMGTFAASSGASFFFPGATRLDSLVRGQRNPMVVLRYWSGDGKAPPRYLVGNCYVNYENKIWKTRGEREELQPTVVAGDSRTFQVVPSLGESAVEDRVEMAGRGLSLFHPREALALRLPSPTLGRRYGDTFEASNQGDFSGAYQVIRGGGEQFPRSRWEEGGRDLEVCLQLPANLPPLVGDLARQIVGEEKSERRRALLLESYLQQHYRYGFEYRIPKKVDPIAEFLEKKPPGHCELFASALTLMLRTRGIPARYINGFTVTEQSPGGYWVVRARQAHAWVEAYVEGGWIRLDPTPPGSSLSPSPSSLETFMEWLAYRVRQGRGVDVGAWLGRLKVSPRGWLFYLLGIFLALALLRYRRHFSWKRAPAPLPVEELPALLQRFEALVGISRPAHVTLARWARQQDASVATFVQLYTRLRYGGQAEELGVEKLRAMVDELERSKGSAK